MRMSTATSAVARASCAAAPKRSTRAVTSSPASASPPAIATMRRYNKFRVPYFQALLDQARKQALQPEAGREIVRRPGNPMLRYVAGVADDRCRSRPLQPRRT